MSIDNEQHRKTVALQKLMRDPTAVLALMAENEALRNVLQEAADELRELKASVGFRGHTLAVLQRIGAAMGSGEQS